MCHAEYAYTLKVNEKTDIYSFGVVLLELLTGRRPVECEFGDAMNIVEWVRAKMAGRQGPVLRDSFKAGRARSEDDDDQAAAMLSEAKRNMNIDDQVPQLPLDCNVCRWETDGGATENVAPDSVHNYQSNAGGTEPMAGPHLDDCNVHTWGAYDARATKLDTNPHLDGNIRMWGSGSKGVMQKAPHICSRWGSNGGRSINYVANADHNDYAAAMSLTSAGGTNQAHHQHCKIHSCGTDSGEGPAAADATAVPAGEGLGIPLLDCNAGASCWWVQEEMLLVLRIALLCTSRFPRDRPSMRDVITMLAEAKPRRKLASSSHITSTRSSCQFTMEIPLL